MRGHSLALALLAGTLLHGQAQAEDVRIDVDGPGWRALSHHVSDEAAADYCVLMSGDQVDGVDGRKLKPLVMFYRSPNMTITVGDPAWLLPSKAGDAWLKIDIGAAYFLPLQVTWNSADSLRTDLSQSDARSLLTMMAQSDAMRIRIGQQQQAISLVGASRALAVFRACAGDLGSSVLSNPLQDPMPLVERSAEKASN